MTDEEREDIGKLRKMLGGDGSIIPDDLLYELVCEYNGSMCASWLIIDRGFLDNFCGWLVHVLLWERGFKERTLT